jgi:biopolymer transport protein ExbB/TolQ
MNHPSRNRVLTLVIFGVFGFLTFVVLNLLPAEDQLTKRFVKCLVDRDDDINWFALQLPMWIVFFVGIGDLTIRMNEAGLDSRELDKNYLPEDGTTLLGPGELKAIYQKVRDQRQDRYLPRAIARIILQFRTTNSIGQSHATLSSCLELFQHEVDLRYNMLRYFAWFIPSMGFIGTVMGIADALAYAGQANPNDPQFLTIITSSLGFAFYTTLLALIMSSILVFLMHLSQGKEEGNVNSIGQYCLDNLINRLLEQK